MIGAVVLTSVLTNYQVGDREGIKSESARSDLARHRCLPQEK